MQARLIFPGDPCWAYFRDRSVAEQLGEPSPFHIAGEEHWAVRLYGAEADKVSAWFEAH